MAVFQLTEILLQHDLSPKIFKFIYAPLTGNLFVVGNIFKKKK